MDTFYEIALFLPTYLGPPALITPLFPAPHQWTGSTRAGYRQLPAPQKTAPTNKSLPYPNSLDEADDKDYHLFVMIKCQRYKWPEILQTWLRLNADQRTEGAKVVTLSFRMLYTLTNFPADTTTPSVLKGIHGALTYPDALHMAFDWDKHLVLMSSSDAYNWPAIITMWTAYRGEVRTKEFLNAKARKIKLSDPFRVISFA
jgi:hypothetical protein